MVISQIQKVQKGVVIAVLGISAGSTCNWLYALIKSIFKKMDLLCVRRCWEFISVGVGKCQSKDSFVCYGANPTQRGCARDFPRDWMMREGRSQSQEKESEHKRPGQSTEVGGTRQSKEVDRTDQSTEVGGS